MTAPTPPPPGWYVAPDGNSQRWWDGNAWGPFAPVPHPGPVQAIPDALSADDATVKGAALVVMAGALVGAIGSFLAWVTISGPDGLTLSRSGFQDGRDGPYILGLAIIAVLAAVARITGWKMPAIIVRGAGVIDGLIMTGVGIADAISVYHRVHETKYTRLGLTGSVGIGLYLVIAGGVAITCAAVYGLGGWDSVKPKIFAGFGSNPPITK